MDLSGNVKQKKNCKMLYIGYDDNDKLCITFFYILLTLQQKVHNIRAMDLDFRV